MNGLKQTVFNMLTENTGRHMLDSGGAYGRHWERNQDKKLKDFENKPSVTWELEPEAEDTSELNYTISVFHYLTSGWLELDDICKAFNKLSCDDWKGFTYGVSKDQTKWLEKHGFDINDSNSFNTYNEESALSQVLQGTFIKLGDNDYLLLQIHGGCDVRGGYTDAKLFRYNDIAGLGCTCLYREDVLGVINGKQADNHYDGFTITDDGGKPIKLEKKGNKIDLCLADY